jgi:hypothetical protein
MFTRRLVRTGHPGGLEQYPLRRRIRAETWCLHRLRQLPFPSWRPMHLQKQEPLGSGCPALWRARRAASFIHTTVCVPGHSTFSSLSDGTLKWRDSGSRCLLDQPRLCQVRRPKNGGLLCRRRARALHLTGFAFHIAKPTRRKSDYQT